MTANDWKRYGYRYQSRYSLGSDSYANINEKKLTSQTKNRSIQNRGNLHKNKHQYSAHVWQSKWPQYRMPKVLLLTALTGPWLIAYQIQGNGSKMTS
jgi:hypothetical protein